MIKHKGGNPLKPASVAGLIVALIISWSIVFLAINWGNDIPGTRLRIQENPFERALFDYDIYDAPKRVLEGDNPDQIEARLSRLQRQARSVEEHLSVLKRRRALALLDRRFIASYEKAAREAAEVFAYSPTLAAVASDAVVMEGGSISRETAALLNIYAPRLSQNRFGLLELSVHVLAGNLNNPASAFAAAGMESLISRNINEYGIRESGSPGVRLPARIRQDLLINEFLIRTVRGDIQGASAILDSLLAGTETGIRRMGAEFFYDHRNPMKAAGLFLSLAGDSRLNTLEYWLPSGDADAAWAADALFLAGETAGARNIWMALSGGNDPDILPRGLYNLASTSKDAQEERSWLERYFSTRGIPHTGTIEIFSTLRYTRHIDTERAISILGVDSINTHPLLDWELLRRRMDTLPANRARAEVWLLLNRHSGEEALYEWAAWYFDHQMLFDENTQLLTDAARRGFTGSWLYLHRAFSLLREGKTSEAERVLRNAPTASIDWRIPANLGRIQESRRSISLALEYYENAASLLTVNNIVRDNVAAARIQMRLSRCYEALGRSRESRRAMELALEYDPDNLNIRRELRRLDNR